ncbi:uncharacterized protein PAC_08403 [Phialocephala subalpina]|uniref:Zn(2)-C6 fungal-type domain-containing protein n=1 Tax=Phialocephala subalpina TaxID=576137 RepID=A0A1L7X0H7_9HELO|nr:uncharacterized protein PAC_08403 [Phialocephala subalpina]
MDRRVRTGCLTCRKRRVKCDQAKPTCNRCRNANYECEGYQPPRQAGAPPSDTSSPRRSRDGSPSELSYRHTDWRQEQLPLYHHFVTITASKLFRLDHVTFWRDQVAQMSYEMDVVHEALLAIGAMHRASLLTCQKESAAEAARFRVLGLQAYGNTLRLVPKYITSDAVPEISAALVVLMLLAYFECFMENPKSAFRHLYAAIQLFQKSEPRLSAPEISNLIPVHDAMLRLDFLAQKVIPYSRSSFLRCEIAFNEPPYWNRSGPSFPGTAQSDQIASERYRLLRLICGHNRLSRVIWGCWCPVNERPSRQELMGFCSEMQLWRENSPATFGSCDANDYESTQAKSYEDLENLPVPPRPLHFESTEAALNIAMCNCYLSCALGMISTTDTTPSNRDLEAFNLVYANMRIGAELIQRHDNWRTASPYKPCDSISMGITTSLYHGSRRCFSKAWQAWTIAGLRSIGKEGLSNGKTLADTFEVMCQIEERLRRRNGIMEEDLPENASLGPIKDRMMPLLMPPGDDDQLLAFYLRFGHEGEQAVQVVAKATWKISPEGSMADLKLNIYEERGLADRPEATALFYSWRQAVETGWSGYLSTEAQLQREGMANF